LSKCEDAVLIVLAVVFLAVVVLAVVVLAVLVTTFVGTIHEFVVSRQFSFGDIGICEGVLEITMDSFVDVVHVAELLSQGIINFPLSLTG
jgi:hypothetical protein